MFAATTMRVARALALGVGIANDGFAITLTTRPWPVAWVLLSLEVRRANRDLVLEGRGVLHMPIRL